MKKFINAIMLLCVTTLFGQDLEDKMDKEIQLAKDKVFNVLKSFDKVSISNYYDIFITLEEVRQLGRSKKFNITNEKRNQLTSYLKIDYTNKLRKDLNEILLKKDVLDLDLDKIIFYDFVYKKIESNTGIEKYECYLMFEEDGENDKFYGIEFTLYNTDNGIEIVEIDDLNGGLKEKWINNK